MVNVFLLKINFSLFSYRGQEAIIKFDTTLDFRAPIHARFLR